MRQESESPAPHLRVRRERGHTVLEFRGEIDIASASRIEPRLDRETRRPGALVVLDLGGIEFFDCSGLRLLHRARRQVLAGGGQVHLVCAHPLTLRMLRITGLSRLLPPRPTLEEVLGVSLPAARRTGR
ncbi:anti-sigma factor antagonist [Streptomyces parvulus]|uniref:Anti-sigma factor antagonist n=1 Tax=Streptomyces parvulus TaxID=146923 RepID=A0A191V715_9ACTN|nr:MULTISPECIES: anti-sigma factor antagonist [Streptomyces]MZD58348.1 anti-sigma factor antagonist [Streptomyces sp. SID5606]ANJ10811.1 anti-anti-sigma factor [Streptomyces parvulus]MCC9155565.1 anti-sigma factor antagonist [Streptomyces parvulus]MCE7687819.1 anti-sigma factor antagonist [Streptomyces parvulus]MCQ4192755.1 anti-sigma factor antagonist [Streptomyces parvulus]